SRRLTAVCCGRAAKSGTRSLPLSVLTGPPTIAGGTDKRASRRVDPVATARGTDRTGPLSQVVLTSAPREERNPVATALGTDRPGPPATAGGSDLRPTVCLLPYCLLPTVFSVPARGTQGGPYQPSTALITVRAFFS